MVTRRLLTQDANQRLRAGDLENAQRGLIALIRSAPQDLNARLRAAGDLFEPAGFKTRNPADLNHAKVRIDNQLVLQLHSPLLGRMTRGYRSIRICGRVLGLLA